MPADVLPTSDKASPSSGAARCDSSNATPSSPAGWASATRPETSNSPATGLVHATATGRFGPGCTKKVCPGNVVQTGRSSSPTFTNTEGSAPRLQDFSSDRPAMLSRCSVRKVGVEVVSKKLQRAPFLSGHEFPFIKLGTRSATLQVR